MTAMEAMEILRDTPIDIRSTREDDIHTLYATAQGMAIEALEKQIPKKPNQKTNESLMHINHGDKPHEIKQTTWEGLRCPRCGGVVGIVVKMRKYEHRQNLHDFCPECGQKIDWTEAGDTNG